MEKTNVFYIRDFYRIPQQRKPKHEKHDRKWWQCVYNYVDSYWSLSTFHGFRHFTAVHHHWSEYMFWLIFILLAISGTSYLSLKAWYRNQNFPTVNTIDRDFTTWYTILPSIMICPKYKLDQSKLHKYVSGYPANKHEEIQNFIIELATIEYSNLHSGLTDSHDILSDNYMALLDQLRFGVKYRLENNNFNSQFIGEMGICHVFNSILSYNQMVPNGRNTISANMTSQLISGRPFNGDIVAVIIDINTPYTAQFSEPSDVPDIMAKRYEGKLNSYLSFELKTMSTVSTSQVRELDINQRKCRLPHESNLIISPVYSYNLCRMNCRRTLALELCKCSPHFYPKIRNTAVCDMGGLRCLSKYKDLLLHLINRETQERVKCDCLSPCDQQLNYVVNTNTVPWFMGTTLKWSIGDFPKMRIKREIIYTSTDLLVSIGGIAGLFLGCSILSFVEIFYFFTFRLFFTLKIKFRGN